MDDDDREFIFRWGLPLNELYTVALKFYKEKEGNVIQFSYGEKLKLLAYTRQVVHGKYNEDVLSPLGVLDVIGRDRRMAWQALGDMKPRDAMAAFVQLIDKSCLHFKTFVQAQKAEMDEQKRIAEEKRKTEEIEMQEKLKSENDEKPSKQQKGKYSEEDVRKRQIQEALNAQTFHQFKSYAEQQYPGNPEEQAILIRQLQDQHYHQYMLQLKQQQQTPRKQSSTAEVDDSENRPCVASRSERDTSENEQNDNSVQDNNNRHCHHCILQRAQQKQSANGSNRYRETNEVENVIDIRQRKDESSDFYEQTVGPQADFRDNREPNEISLTANSESLSPLVDGENSESEDSEGDITQSFMWTRKDIDEFKAEIKKEGGETIVKISHGEIVTIRVPTREDGSYLYWEFATDNYDIGFGIQFEWEKSNTNEMSIHVSESEEDSDDLLDDDQDLSDVDAEQSQIARSLGRIPKTPTSVIIPIYRRDCHQEVYFGYHKYPAEGVYLLKFDNSYSLWRSKTLYYRIYYTNHIP